ELHPENLTDEVRESDRVPGGFGGVGTPGRNQTLIYYTQPPAWRSDRYACVGHYRREMMPPMKLSNDRRAHEGARPTWQPIPAWRWMLAAAAAVVITAFVVTIWLLTIASHAKPGT